MPQRRRRPTYGQVRNAVSLASDIYKLGSVGYSYYNKPSRKKKTYKKKPKANTFNKPTRRAPRTFPKKVKAQIRELKRLTESDMGTLTYRKLENGSWFSAQNLQNTHEITGSTNVTIEAALAQLRYYNPSSPGTLLTADGTTGTYNKEFLIKSTYSNLTMKNSFMVPVNVQVYLCRPKRDTSITPSEAWQDGLTDISSGVLISSILTYPTDSPIFNDLYSIVKKKSYRIEAGKNITCKHYEKAFQYEPSFNDEHALTYQKKNKSFVWMVVIQGDISHDSNDNSLKGTTGVSLDYMVTNKYVIQYSAGADIKFLHVDTSELTNQPASALTGVVRIPDNISYSPT